MERSVLRSLHTMLLVPSVEVTANGCGSPFAKYAKNGAPAIVVGQKC